MPSIARKITPCLWFDTQAEAAARFYVSVFPNSRLGRISRYGNEGRDIHGKAPGTVMVVKFAIDGQNFVALNGGPRFTFDEAVRFRSIATARTRSTITGANSASTANMARAAG